jgi:hypothetical protein
MILQNQIRCLVCGDEPYSAHRHDFKYCKCGAVAVDGGMSYLRRIGDPLKIEEMSIVMDDRVMVECEVALKWARENGRNDLGALCAVMRVLDRNGYKQVNVPKEVPADPDKDVEIEQLKRELKFWMLRADTFETVINKAQDILVNR